jgi:hypothetical protein
LILLDYFELSALGNGTLVDVATENELDSCGRKALQHQVAPPHGTLMSGTPRRCSEMMMKRRRPQRPSLGAFQLGYEALELGRFESAALLTPRPDRVQPNDSEPTRDVDRLRRSEDTIPLIAGPGEARREDVRNIMVPRNGEEW